MSNPFFNALGGGGNQLMQSLQQLKSNPMQFLAQRRLNVPANLANDPSAILQHLVQTGQVSQDAVNRVYQQIGQFKR